MIFHLKQCVWEITLACPFNCKYCGSGGGRARENELTTKECLDIADALADLGCNKVSLIGGEIFMRRDWIDICRRLTSLGIHVVIITNGFLFTNDIISAIKQMDRVSVSVSIDGPEEVHDKYRQMGSYARAMKAVRTLVASQIPVSVISTLNSENVKMLPSFLNQLKESGIYAWQLQACSPMGNAALSGIDYAFDMGEVIRFVEDNRTKVPFALGVADNIGYFTPEEGHIRGTKNSAVYFPGCQAGISAIGIDSVGNVRGCESMYDEAFIEGNVRMRSLKDIWEDEEAFAYNRGFKPDMLTGACSSCPEGPYCAGGCRSYNYFVHGKLYESPFCALKDKH